MAKHDTAGQGPPDPSPLVGYPAFRDLVGTRARPLLTVAVGSIALRPGQLALTRPLLGQILAESSQLEELLDAYGARTSGQWYVFRTRIAALKNFSQAGYELLHLAHAAQSYNLREQTPAFVKDTEDTVRYLAGLLLCSLKGLYAEAQTLGLSIPAEGLRPDSFIEVLPPGRLPRDRTRVHQETVTSRVLSLATQFLHDTERASFLRKIASAKPQTYASLIGDQVSEERLRGLEMRFHNLQSLYDTYVSDSETETLDPQLPALRGHTSAVLHLLRIGTILVHFYERHIRLNRQALFQSEGCAYTEEEFLGVIVVYCLGYSQRFLDMARRICRQMLRRYAQVETTEVPVPRFHGFHVRPSTLVAAIVGHYGSEITMECGGVTYNAGVPMDFFRANEWINRQKREFVYAQLAALPLARIEQEAGDRRLALRDTLFRLAERRTIVIHEHPLPLDGLVGQADVPFDEVLRSAIAALLAERKINIESDILVRFTGDRRVLQDIRILAKSGYGEDAAGNNTVLPETLGYLRYSRPQ
jgi:hypothetical protein